MSQALAAANLLNDLAWVNTYCSADLNEFRDIESPFPKLELRYERLPLSEPFAKLHLGYARIFPSLHKQFDHSLIEVGSE